MLGIVYARYDLLVGKVILPVDKVWISNQNMAWKDKRTESLLCCWLSINYQ